MIALHINLFQTDILNHMLQVYRGEGAEDVFIADIMAEYEEVAEIFEEENQVNIFHRHI